MPIFLLLFFLLGLSQASPSSTWFESFSIDAYPCDLSHEPLPDKAYQAGDFVRICIQATSDNSDLVIVGLNYFWFLNEETEDEEQLIALLQENHAQAPSIACSAQNMCVVESILDDKIHLNQSTTLYGYGSIVLERSESNELFTPMNDITLSLQLKPVTSFLRGKIQNQ
jgi:predicted MPP superfamily phosphohydrolase